MSLKIEFGAHDAVDMFEEEVGKIVEAIGYDPVDVFVSDESTFGDFKLCEQELRDVGRKCGFEIEPEDRIVDIAKKMANKKKD